MVSLRELNRGAERYLREQAGELGFTNMWDYRRFLAEADLDYIDELRASPGEGE